jgi:CheY-like chemotaxis protein
MKQRKMSLQLNNTQQRKRILVADDDTAILEVISMMLEDAGYDVKTTVNGQTEKFVKEYSPHLILLDIWMAGMDGRVICKSLKGNKLTRHIPIVMISANKDTKKIAIESGADNFIEKPFEMDHLLATVAQYAGKNDTV